MSGQLHAPPALLPEKEPPVLTGQRAEWAPGPVWRRLEVTALIRWIDQLHLTHFQTIGVLIL